jgi:hypothetical protein
MVQAVSFELRRQVTLMAIKHKQPVTTNCPVLRMRVDVVDPV